MGVQPLEIIHMDENGAVKFPREYLEEVVIRAKRVVAKEAKMQDALRRTGGDLEKIKMVLTASTSLTTRRRIPAGKSFRFPCTEFNNGDEEK